MKRSVSSAANVPVAMPRSFKPFAISSYGLSCSCHARMSAPLAIGPFFSCSMARASSKCGVTMKGFPFAGSTSASRRSLIPHWSPVK
jgi:hypothetical protein